MNRIIISKFFAILSVILVLFNILIITQINATDGYEVSIYNAFPIYFWIFIIFSIWFSLICIAFAYNHSKSWTYGIISILLNYAIVLFLPTIRGYQFFATTSYDLFAHLSWVEEILNSGHLNPNLIYPMTHILTAIFNLFGMDTSSLISINFTHFLFSSLYLLYIVILGKEMTDSARSGLIFLFFASPIMFSYLNHAFIPYGFALFMLPLFIYLLYKRKYSKNGFQFSFLLILVSFILIFFHPLIGINLLIILFTYYVYSILCYKKDILDNGKNVGTLIIMIFTSYLVWHMGFRQFSQSIGKLVQNIFFPENTMIIDRQLEVVNASNATFLDLIIISMKLYGHYILYMTLSLFFIILFLKDMYSKKQYGDNTKLNLLFLISVSIFAAIQIFSLSLIYEIIRVLAIPIMFIIFFCSSFVSDTFKNKSSSLRKKIILFVCVCIVCSSSILGLLCIYDSPWKGSAGPHMTKMDLYGVNWYLTYNNNDYYLLSNIESLHKYEMYYSQINVNPLQNPHRLAEKIPSHFGYNEHSLFSDNFDEVNIYLITQEKIKYMYTSVFESEKERYPKYFDSDFELLNQDYTVGKYYSNGEFIVWGVDK
ncbi:hypothetical protein Mpsy_0540 [Methanolobus psychrophilus R15]|nr:hypothetical protein Mpsy_0540 [Methanolobus psychrophilus R15]